MTRTTHVGMTELSSGVAGPSERRKTLRQFLVVLHRWTGLLMTVFLVIVSVTGALLAFDVQIDRLVNPQLFVPPRPGVRPLDLASLAIDAEKAEPRARVGFFGIPPSVPDRALIVMEPRTDPATGKPYTLTFNRIFLDPYTGAELAKRREGDLSEGRINIVPFLYNLHTSLALGDAGALVLGIVALAWTIDCFIGFYLTLPLGASRFVRRWKPAWLVKWRAGAFRVNFDVHRASGLWLWPLLFVFAWSSVMFNLRPLYEGVTSAVLGMTPVASEMQTLSPSHPTEHPRLDWRAALQRGEILMAREAREHNIHVLAPFGLGYIPSLGVYAYDVRTDRDVGGRTFENGVWIDGTTGALQRAFLPDGVPAGDVVSTWLYALHFADFHDLLFYRVLVFLLGIALVILSLTGVYIWLRKRSARIRVRRRSPSQGVETANAAYRLAARVGEYPGRSRGLARGRAIHLRNDHE